MIFRSYGKSGDYPFTPEGARTKRCCIFIPDAQAEIVYALLAAMAVPPEFWNGILVTAHSCITHGGGAMYIVHTDRPGSLEWDSGYMSDKPYSKTERWTFSLQEDQYGATEAGQEPQAPEEHP